MTDRLRADVISAIRTLAAAPGAPLWTVATLAVAVGLNLAMFGLIDRALLSPPSHVADADRVFTLGFEREGDEAGRAVMTTAPYATFTAIRDHVPAAAATAAWQRLATVAVVEGVQLQVDAMLVSNEYFQLLGAKPRLGTGIHSGSAAVVEGFAPAVLSDAFAKRVFGGGPDVLGRRLTVRGVDLVVAGVMPRGFSGHSASRVDVWIPFAAVMQTTPGWETDPFRNIAAVVMKLKSAESAAAAAQQATAAIAGTGRRISLHAIAGAGVRQVERQIVYWLAAVSILLLLVGLANAATLLLARGAGRRRELAIRVVLGATRRRLLSQLFVEAALIALAGTVVALVLSYWLDEAVRKVLVPSVIESSGIGARIGAAAGAGGLLMFVAAAAAGAAGLAGPLHAGDLAGRMRAVSSRRPRTALLVIQTTLCVVLLSGAGVFGRSLYNLLAQDFGMRMHDVLLVEFEPGPGNIDGRNELFTAALEKIRRLPGVERATVIGGLPFSGHNIPPISVPGRPDPPNVDGQLPYLIPSTPELFQILDIRIVQGRAFTAADDRGAPVVIVNEAMARGAWPGESALGKCIRIGFEPTFDPMTATGPPPPPTTVPCREVIGVAHDVRQRAVVPDGHEERLMQYYVPFSQVPPPPFAVDAGPHINGLLVRTSADAEALIEPVRRIVTAGRTDLPFLHVREYAQLIDRQIRAWRLGTVLFSLFGALGLGVAAMGMFAAFAHAVAQRRREMAIRIAVGARPRGVLLMILREAAALAVAGALCGSLLTVLMGQWVRSMLFETAPSDPIVLAGAGLLMLIVGTIATLAPAWGAARTDPNDLLRSDA